MGDRRTCCCRHCRFFNDQLLCKNGTAYIGITTTDNTSAVYKVNTGTAVATRGAQIIGGIITAIQWLPSED